MNWEISGAIYTYETTTRGSETSCPIYIFVRFSRYEPISQAPMPTYIAWSTPQQIHGYAHISPSYGFVY